MLAISKFYSTDGRLLMETPGNLYKALAVEWDSWSNIMNEKTHFKTSVLIYSWVLSGPEKSDTGKCRMWVCHCADNWKNFTPDHSVPSMVTKKKQIYFNYRLEFYLLLNFLSEIKKEIK